MGNVIQDLAEGATGGILGGVGEMAVKLRQAFKGIELDPNKAAEIEAKLAELQVAAIQAQTKINEVEAASPSLFVSGWRPFVGWVCGLGFAYTFLINPLLALVITVYRPELILPVLNSSELTTILIGMLGLVGARSFERYNEVERKK